MSKIWTRGAITALGLLIGLPAVGSAHAHYTGVAPASVKAALVSTSAHAKVSTVKHKAKHKKHKAKAAHKSVHKSALHSTASAHAKHHRSGTSA